MNTDDLSVFICVYLWQDQMNLPTRDACRGESLAEHFIGARGHGQGIIAGAALHHHADLGGDRAGIPVRLHRLEIAHIVKFAFTGDQILVMRGAPSSSLTWVCTAYGMSLSTDSSIAKPITLKWLMSKFTLTAGEETCCMSRTV